MRLKFTTVTLVIDLKLSFFQSITSSVSNSVGGNVEHIGGNYRLLN